MRLSEERKGILIVLLDALNKTVGGPMADIKAAEDEVKKHMPKIGIYLEYSDYTNRWFFADKNGNEVDLTTDFQRKWDQNAAKLVESAENLQNERNQETN